MCRTRLLTLLALRPRPRRSARASRAEGQPRPHPRCPPSPRPASSSITASNWTSTEPSATCGPRRWSASRTASSSTSPSASTSPPIIADNLSAKLDGKELTFRCVEQRSVVLDHVRCDFRFVADWKLSPQKQHQFSFREGNYPLDSFSHLAVRLSHSPKLTLRDATAPENELIDRPAERAAGPATTSACAPCRRPSSTCPRIPRVPSARRCPPISTPSARHRKGLSRYASVRANGGRRNGAAS